MDADISRQILAVIFVFVLLALAVWKLRPGALRYPWSAGQRSATSLQSVERVALTPQHSIHVVRVHGRELVVATHPQGCSLLLPPSPEETR